MPWKVFHVVHFLVVKNSVSTVGYWLRKIRAIDCLPARLDTCQLRRFLCVSGCAAAERWFSYGEKSVLKWAFTFNSFVLTFPAIVFSIVTGKATLQVKINARNFFQLIWCNFFKDTLTELFLVVCIKTEFDFLKYCLFSWLLPIKSIPSGAWVFHLFYQWKLIRIRNEYDAGCTNL